MQLSLDCLKSAKFDSNNATVIQHSTFTLPPEQYSDQMTPLSEASSFLEQADSHDLAFSRTFQERYGQYCITGQRRRFIFFAVSTYSSENREDLDNYVAGVSAGITTPIYSLSASTKVEISDATSMSSIKEHHQIFVVGIDLSNMGPRLSTISL